MAKGGDLDVSVVHAQVVPERHAPVTVLSDAGGAPIGTGGARLGHLCNQCRNADCVRPHTTTQLAVAGFSVSQQKCLKNAEAEIVFLPVLLTDDGQTAASASANVLSHTHYTHRHTH